MLNWLRANHAWLVDLWIRLKGRALSRRAGYLILAATALESDIIQLLVTGAFKLGGVNLDVPKTPHYVALSFVGVAALLLIVDRLFPEKAMLPTAYPADEKLLYEVRKLITPDVDAFLREHPFESTSFERELIAPLGIIGAWKGPKYEFIDTAVQAAWESVVEKNRSFLRVVALYTWPSRSNPDWQTPYPDQEDADNPSALTKEHIKMLDDGASGLVKSLDDFDAIARRRIPNV